MCTIDYGVPVPLETDLGVSPCPLLAALTRKRWKVLHLSHVNNTGAHAAGYRSSIKYCT